MRAPVSAEDLLLEGAASYFWYAERFGWTPAEVEEVPAWLCERLPVIARLNDEVVEDRQRGAIPAAERP